jgi:hypothetical protein
MPANESFERGFITAALISLQQFAVGRSQSLRDEHGSAEGLEHAGKRTGSHGTSLWPGT